MADRPRGRARGRGRSSANGQAPEPARRPGTHAQGPPPPQPAAVSGTNGAEGSGMRHGRNRGNASGGGASSRPGGMPQAEGDTPVQEMSQLSVSAYQAGAGGDGDGKRQGTTNRRGLMIEVTLFRRDGLNKQVQSRNHVTLVTNYFHVTVPQHGMFQYHVHFNPNVPSKKLRKQLLDDHRDLLGGLWMFGTTILYLPHQLPDKETEVFSKLPTDGSNVKITIKLTNELPPNSPSAIQMYNVILRRVLQMKGMNEIRRQFYDQSAAISVPQHNMTILPGFITSILPYENDILLSANVDFKLLNSKTVYDLMDDLYCKMRNAGTMGDFHNQCVKKLLGAIVLTRYNNKTYRIDDISTMDEQGNYQATPESTFQLRNGTAISFIEYYKKHYNIQIQDPQQPMLISRSRKRCGPGDEPQEVDLLLVPELCVLTGLSDEMRSDFRVMKDLAVHTRLDPMKRYQSLTNFMNGIKSKSEITDHLCGWGMDFANKPLELDGHVLQPEAIYQAKKTPMNYNPQHAEWSREIRSEPMLTSVPLNDWLLLFAGRDSSLAQGLVQALSRVGPPQGVEVKPPKFLELRGQAPTGAYLTAIKENMTRETQLVVCILGTNAKDRYDAIKKHCCCVAPVPSQVILSRTLSKPAMLMSVCTKVLQQINTKMGGEPWGVNMPLQEYMICGIDTYHVGKGEGKSVGALVASLNGNATRYVSQTSPHVKGDELSSHLPTMLLACLKKYYDLNKTLPKGIIIYRDGVGDGQLDAVLGNEVKSLEEMFEKRIPSSVHPAYKPRLAVIVVKKRINTRFMLPGRSMTNPPPGTCVDQVVTRKEWYDFYLVSQSVRQGTVCPTHYNIIYDSTGITPEHLQRLTYKLCHLYYNWPGTIRVPAPCQYAHKLAYLTGQSLRDSPRPELCDKLFFL